ncbi:MAG: restriction endonuclease [Clostridiaceae bacterium]|nr:restriction endonuclease [Clostridiaceae bacterium]
MLIMYLLLILVTIIVYELVSWIIHIYYLVKISLLADNIECKDDLLYLKLKDYEYVIAEVFRRQGYKVQMSDHFGEGGNGIILNDIYYVIVRKESYHNLVEIEQAKKLVKHMRDNNIHRGMIITLGDFKSNTKNYCHMNVIKCINGDQLIQMFKSVQALSAQSAFLR